MKTNKNKTSKSGLLVRVGMTLSLASALILSASFVKGDTNSNNVPGNDKVDQNYKLNKGSYWASEFYNFKKENLRSDLYAENQLSEKVLFKAFVIFKKHSRVK